MSQSAPEKQKSSTYWFYNSMFWREMLRDCLMQWWGLANPNCTGQQDGNWQGFCVAVLRRIPYSGQLFLKAFNRLDDIHHIMEGNLFNSKSTDFNVYLLKVPQFKCQPHLKISSQQYLDWCMTKQLAPLPT